jgi:hypothetical protein
MDAVIVTAGMRAIAGVVEDNSAKLFDAMPGAASRQP